MCNQYSSKSKHKERCVPTDRPIFDSSHKILKGLPFHFFSLFHLAACDLVCLPPRGWVGLVGVSGIGRFCQSSSLEEARLRWGLTRCFWCILGVFRGFFECEVAERIVFLAGLRGVTIISELGFLGLWFLFSFAMRLALNAL